MDLNSWTPRDISRRLALLVGFLTGCFVALVLIGDAGWNLWNALLVGVPSGFVAGGLTFWMSRQHYRRKTSK